jgi:hypothetical protein
MYKHRRRRILIAAFLFAVSAVGFSACGGSGDNEKPQEILQEIENTLTGNRGSVKDDPDAPERDATPQALTDVASGEAVFDGEGATVDFSNIDDGYIMARYDGDNPKVKLQITKAGTNDPYTYDLTPNADWDSFPIQESASYTIAVFLNVEGDKYSQAAAQEVSANLTNEFAPFLRPTQYSWYTNSSQAVAEAEKLAKGAKSDLKVIENIFIWITENIIYDYEKATTVQSGYFPTIDETLATGKGICFDYAALTTAMLRSQRIPCRLAVGYAGSAYHAWISVHVDGIGWVDNMIQFNGDKWTRMDPTFAASGDTADPNVVGDGTTYNPMYYY